MGTTPFIKGVFIKSHIEAVRQAKGEEGMRELARRYGKSLRFRAMEYVPVREEVAIIECALDVLFPGAIPAGQKIFEAGRLHFRNFSATPYGRIIFSALPRNFKAILMNARYIAQHVFRNVKFTSSDLGECALKVTMENNDYPLEHFKGFFYEWMRFFALPGAAIEAQETAPGTFEYVMRWEKS